ncbi:MAG: integration host factor subunit beta [Candidatus Marinimicrobia bacterium]|nr:integration host factor subunit beta [Candidatus Neomarinimicrobiota bacterium]MBL7023252.1 integration host factor subunit beta [Candidatus Neomarinimicrobiota bacterium]MBL7108846.1 integration host factor subunit beta [Candidatus Neomarinimicrobiota bacterium]
MKPITYTKRDIIVRTSSKLGIPEKNMKDIVESVIETMTDMLTQPKSRLRIELRNFGVFEIKPTKAKPRARNPQTNEEVYVPPRRKVMFKPGKIIRDKIHQEWNEKD